MPALNFKREFVEKIRSGEKTCTIRASRKKPFEAGQQLYLYTGQRTSQCEKLMTVICTETTALSINFEIKAIGLWFPTPSVVAARLLAPDEVKALAKLDGFESVDAFLAFFQKIARQAKERQFLGQIISWGKPGTIPFMPILENRR